MVVVSAMSWGSPGAILPQPLIKRRAFVGISQRAHFDLDVHPVWEAPAAIGFGYSMDASVRFAARRCAVFSGPARGARSEARTEAPRKRVG
jgi:hypothetical protein